MSGLNEQIAVLDGLAALDPNDGRIGRRRAPVYRMPAQRMDANDGRLGQHRSQVNQYARIIAPGVLAKAGVIDASGGGNFSGGSNYPDIPIPLMPSSVGLAGFGSMPGVLPIRVGVVDPGGGQNYSGGSSWTGGMPLLPSNAGLANGEYGRAGLGSGEYGRAGLGSGEYGRAGLGRLAGSMADADLAAAAEQIAVARSVPYRMRQLPMDGNDGRIGQHRAQVNQYARIVAPGVLSRTGVIDASGGANYSGGSNYPDIPIPLMPSSVGLAGLDAAADAKLGIQGPLRKQIGKEVLVNLKKKLLSVEKLWTQANAMQKEQLWAQYRATVAQLLQHLHGVRVMRAKALAVKRAGGVPGRAA